MESTTFVQPGSLPRPKFIGLSVRLMLGIACCYAALFYGAPRLPASTGVSPIVTVRRAGPSVLVPPACRESWVQSQLAKTVATRGLILGLGGTVIDLLVYEQLWAPPLGALVYGMTVYTFTHLGISYVLATLLRTPGCEMRAIPDLLGRLTGRTAAEHHCPGFITPLDNWEARRG